MDLEQLPTGIEHHYPWPVCPQCDREGDPVSMMPHRVVGAPYAHEMEIGFYLNICLNCGYTVVVDEMEREALIQKLVALQNHQEEMAAWAEAEGKD